MGPRTSVALESGKRNTRVHISFPSDTDHAVLGKLLISHVSNEDHRADIIPKTQ